MKAFYIFGLIFCACVLISTISAACYYAITRNMTGVIFQGFLSLINCFSIALIILSWRNQL
jgi:hypothetical protein